ncbi:MAG: hypothetical protein ACT4OE_08660 [Sphingosinicella sp.]
MAAAWGDQEEISPDGRLAVRWAYDSGLGNVEYRKPELSDVVTGETLFDLADDAFDCQIEWLPDARLVLHAARQSGPAARLLVDPARRSFAPLASGVPSLEPAGASLPLAELRTWLAGRLET